MIDDVDDFCNSSTSLGNQKEIHENRWGWQLVAVTAILGALLFGAGGSVLNTR
jgi:hypothetical protein